MNLSPDIAIVGSGIGGATLAYGLGHTGGSILILERGKKLGRGPLDRNDRAIFQQKAFHANEHWWDSEGRQFRPGNFYNVGGNSKFYGAVMYRYREVDFSPREYPDGTTPGWPFSYSELEQWYGKAERLFQVHGETGRDPTDPPRSTPFDYPSVPDEPAIAEFRRRLVQIGLHPHSLPLAINIDLWLAGGRTPWDGFPGVDAGKIDAESGPLTLALQNENVLLEENAEVIRLESDSSGRRINAIVVRRNGEILRIKPGIVVLAAGGINSAIILLRSWGTKASQTLANASDQVGRNFMNHNCTAMLAFDPRLRNSSIYQKTLGLNDFYIADPATNRPLGNVQLLGKVSAAILKANISIAPEFFLKPMAAWSFDWLLMNEDLPRPDSRVAIDGDRINLHWRRSNMDRHEQLVKRMREIFKAAGFPIVLSRAFDKRAPSHQCGTVRMGCDPAQSVVDRNCRAHDIENLYVVDASVLPTSGAVNPALTVAALALRAANHLRFDRLGCK